VFSATFEEYRKLSQHDIIRTIEHEMSGDLAVAMKVGSTVIVIAAY
jgi:hypothetical protein